MHGRAQPPAGRDLRREFTAALAGWEWDVALLQEVPPWWPAPLAAELDAEYRFVLTSRNGLLAAAPRDRDPLAGPDQVKRRRRQRDPRPPRPDRRPPHAAAAPLPRAALGARRRLACGIWVVNLHAVRRRAARAARRRAGRAAPRWPWAAGEPLVVGGDFNLREPRFDGLRHVGERDVDHIFIGDGVEIAGPAEVLDRGTLSDHPPLVVTRRAARDA